MTSFTLFRLGLAFIWLYNGLILKLIYRPTEAELIALGPDLADGRQLGDAGRLRRNHVGLSCIVQLEIPVANHSLDLYFRRYPAQAHET